MDTFLRDHDIIIYKSYRTFAIYAAIAEIVKLRDVTAALRIGRIIVGLDPASRSSLQAVGYQDICDLKVAFLRSIAADIGLCHEKRIRFP